MNTTRAGTWHDDPAHFRRPTRRAFLHVGLVGGLGLTLADFFRLQAHAEAVGAPGTPVKEAPAQSIIHINCVQSSGRAQRLSRSAPRGTSAI